MGAVELETLNYDGGGKVVSPFEMRGPLFRWESGSHILKQLARFWSKSSEILASVVQQSGTKYYHFLQSNQYVKDRKVDVVNTIERS